MVFDEAVGTTFSMDPAVLLSVPVHLALLGGNQRTAMRDGIAVLEAVRRLSDRITVYAQRGRLQVPSPPHVLYGLLEQMTVEVNAPRGGVFHPKLWLMRFVAPDDAAAVTLRLMVLSRNLTNDRSWDVALTLEGSPTGRKRSENRELAQLIGGLPQLAVGDVEGSREEQASRLAAELHRTKWELPPGFESVGFHVLGTEEGGWCPSWSSRLAVISPFCTDAALRQLRKSTGTASALITRPEAFAALSVESRALFGRNLALDEAAETEDGEDVEADGGHDTSGLHAKVYIFEKGWDTHVVLGSANATNAALLAATNIEVLAEIVGKRSRVGGVEHLLAADGLGEVLVELPEPDEDAEGDPDQQAAEDALEQARDMLAGADLRIRCTMAVPGEDQGWSVVLSGTIGALTGIATARAWPITVGDDHAVDLAPLAKQDSLAIGTFSPASLTGLIAFELRTSVCDLRIRFVLNLPVDGMPAARDTAILQTVVRNRDGFLRYLLLLLGDLGYGPPAPDANGTGGEGLWGLGGPGSMPLLEDLVRAYAREPERLREVGLVIHRLTQEMDGNVGEDIVPADFLQTWQVFETAMERRRG